MCLATDWKDPKIAAKDITVWKIIEKNNLSWIEEEYLSMFWAVFGYNLKTLYTTTLTTGSLVQVSDDEVTEYLDEHHEGWRSPMGYSGVKGVMQGFHSVSKKERLNLALKTFPMALLTRCTIPKGSEYYEGFCHEMVSNQIIIEEIL